MICYKILDQNLCSIVGCGIPQYTVQYKFGEYVKPILKNSHLMVYTGLEGCKSFLNWNNHQFYARSIRPRLLVVDALNVSETGFFLHSLGVWNKRVTAYDLDKVINLLSSKDNNPNIFNGTSGQKQAAFCTDVKLIGEINIDYI